MARTPVIIITGPHSSARAILIGRLAERTNAQTGIGWLISGTLAPTLVGNPRYRQLALVCPCCIGAHALELELTRLLRKQAPTLIVIELAGGCHVAATIDALRANRWRSLLCIQRVVLATADPALELADHLSCDTVFYVPEDCGTMSASCSTFHCGMPDPPEWITSDEIDKLFTPVLDVARLDHWYQPFREVDVGRWSIQWPGELRFDRRAVESTLGMMMKHAAVQTVDAIFSTERAWYRWHVAEGSQVLPAGVETDYRKCSRLHLRVSPASDAINQLNDWKQRLLASAFQT